MLTIRAMSDGSRYSERHLQHSDYYAEGERITGTWQGHGAELLGLSGEVESEQFEALRQGLDPNTGEFLRQRHSADRIGADGNVHSRGRNLYDFTISAPKSVSVMAKVGGDERLIEAHRKAVDEALKELEVQAASRVRKDGANDDRTTGNLVLAVYHHDTSRELDPQLHTHAVAANLTYDGTEGSWKALQASDIYEQRAYLTEVYRNALAREVRSLGYEVEDRRDTKGKDRGFEIKGVSPELIDKYSQRSQQRDRAIEEFTKENGRKPTDNEVAVLVRESRAEKLVEISTDEVHRLQIERLSPDEALGLDQLREDSLDRGSGSERESARESLDYAEQHVFERVSVARDYELFTEALRHGRGRIAVDELKGSFALQEGSGEVLRAGKDIATRETLERERDMISRIDRGIGKFNSLGDNEIDLSSQLRPEQRNAVQFVLGSRDLAVNIRGAAGTGKTATLLELHLALNESGREVVAVAPSMSAVEELQKVGFNDAMTVQRLLQDEGTQQSLSDKVIIADEAGMISGRQMSELLKLAEDQGARLIFSGDTRQIRSVEATDALRILEKESGLNSVSLTHVERQSSAEYREAVQELRRDPERGIAKLDAMGAIREVSWEDRAEAVQKAYSDTIMELSAKGQNPNVLVVAATHDEIEQITAAIRAERSRSGKLGAGVEVERHVSVNWTTAQKQSSRNFESGHVLKFHRAAKGVGKNETLEVVGREGKTVIARNSQGEERTFTSKQAKAFDVYERSKIEIAPNDKLLLMENRREPGFKAVNGELVTVSAIDEKHRIHLQDGRVLPENYKQFAHGYAITAHRSQGKSVDHVIISADGMRRQAFYVAASRGRHGLTVVTKDKERLSETVARSDKRQSAHELVLRRAGAEAREPFTGPDAQPRSISAVRDSRATSS
ncbi:MAG TPA: MobF family relaxase, partial [Terriglobales bacterium]|nr:MobF family relaxase [Terriglobales bacterium]